jgi:hypothetical protein
MAMPKPSPEQHSTLESKRQIAFELQVIYSPQAKSAERKI